MRVKRFKLNVDYSPVGLQATDTVPRLDAYLLDDAVNNYKRKAVIICPGGGYNHLAVREGEPVAMQYLSAGVQAFVLWYSIKPAIFPMQLMELATAVKLVREHAEEWNIDPDQIFVAGFSAGGNLAATLATMWHEEFLTKSLGVTAEEIRPNGQILGYSVVHFNDRYHEGRHVDLLDGLSKEFYDITDLPRRVNELTPPAFMWATWNDTRVPIENSLAYADALRKNDVSCELHIFKQGPHGMALATRETKMADTDPNSEISVDPNVALWVMLAVNWLNTF